MSTKSFRNEAYTSLLKGIKELDFQGPMVPCELVLAGENAFPLVMNNKDQILMAASVYGHGRIVVLAHENYLIKFPALVGNAVSWLMGDQPANLVYVQKENKPVAEQLNKSSFEVNIVDEFAVSLGPGVYVTNAYRLGNPKDLVTFLKAGGGVLIAGQAWHWVSQHPTENTFLQFPGNKVSGVAGIYFAENYGTAQKIPLCSQIPSSLKSIDVGKSFEEDLEPLLKGVSEFNLIGPGRPSDVVVHGSLAFSIATDDDGKSFIAGSYFGKGRVIVAAHDDFFLKENLANFWHNAINWLDQGRQGVVGFLPKIPIISGIGMTCEKTEFRDNLSVFVCKTNSDKHAREIQDFVAEGGGLLIGGHGWWFRQSTNDKTAILPGNKILNKMGLTISDNHYVAKSFEVSSSKQVLKNNLHFRRRLHGFISHVQWGEELSKLEDDQLKNLGRECQFFLQMKAFEDFSYTQVLTFLTDTLKKVGIPQVSESNPVTSQKDIFLLTLGTEVFKVSTDTDLPSYLIKNIPNMPLSLKQRIKINADTAEHSEWISTGLYLPPGMKTDITIPTTMVEKGWTVQIGCHTDHLKKEEFKRAPIVFERFYVASEKMEVSNLWGGLIYLVAPPNTEVEEEEIIVDKAVSAPYYQSGVTTKADWLSQRKAPSPWAEMEFDHIILTVPSKVIRDLEDVDEVAALWNDIMEKIAELSVIPKKFKRKERIVSDVQISVGWLHSGYPIMMHSSAADPLFKHEEAKCTGLLWGPTHELGHNQQKSCMEFSGHTAEATCNLWALYVHEKVMGVENEKAHYSLSSKRRKIRIEKYVEGGKKLSEWSVWTAYETYLQLKEKFGWDAFKKVVEVYQTMDNFPKDNAGKMNQYAEIFSKSEGMNLTGFFKAWGWPIEPATVEKVSSLPPWSDHPMAQYN